MKTRFAIAGTWSARSSTNAGGECSRRAKWELPAGADLRWSLGSPGLPVRPSIAARTIWTARNCRKVGCGVPAPAARRSPQETPVFEPATLGDPMRPLLWVSKSMDKLAAILTGMGHPISADTVRKELVKLGFSRQYNRKAEEGSKHLDRNAQFEHINAKVVAAQAKSQPVISVDTKKKELVGNFKNGGSD